MAGSQEELLLAAMTRARKSVCRSSMSGLVWASWLSWKSCMPS